MLRNLVKKFKSQSLSESSGDDEQREDSDGVMSPVRKSARIQAQQQQQSAGASTSKTRGRWRQVDGQAVATILLTPPSSLFALRSSETPWRLAGRPYCVMFDFERARPPACRLFARSAQVVPWSSSSYVHRARLMAVLIATVCLAVDRCVHIQPGGGGIVACPCPAAIALFTWRLRESTARYQWPLAAARSAIEQTQRHPLHSCTLAGAASRSCTRRSRLAGKRV
uniref:Uncharacterized protein n=1 Tax=Plectus sambesii TaxID=2011161 RepID=A0A914VMU4_9BILA